MYRRSAAVIAHWRRGELVLENYATRTSVAAPAAAAEVLDVCTEWRSMAAILARVDRCEPDYFGNLAREFQMPERYE